MVLGCERRAGTGPIRFVVEVDVDAYRDGFLDKVFERNLPARIVLIALLGS